MAKIKGWKKLDHDTWRVRVENELFGEFNPYSDLIRGIPVLVLIFFVYYGLPALGLNLDNFWAAVAALSAFKVAHVIEITRGAIQSIHHGQTDAAKADKDQASKRADDFKRKTEKLKGDLEEAGATVSIK